jgi:hypothetical protein
MEETNNSSSSVPTCKILFVMIDGLADLNNKEIDCKVNTYWWLCLFYR